MRMQVYNADKPLRQDKTTDLARSYTFGDQFKHHLSNRTVQNEAAYFKNHICVFRINQNVRPLGVQTARGGRWTNSFLITRTVEHQMWSSLRRLVELNSDTFSQTVLTSYKTNLLHKVTVACHSPL